MVAGDREAQRIFFELHRDLPREAPGSDRSTLRALGLVAGPVRRVLDLGSGPGMQTLALARALEDAQIVALDRHRPYLQTLAGRSRQSGVAGRVHGVCADLANLPFSPASFDLLWCEGAIYLLGLERALHAWPALLRRGGHLAFSDAVWLREDVPSPVREFWSAYPGMRSVEEVCRTLAAAGLTLRGAFVQPASDWWVAYYEPLAERIALLRAHHAGNPVARAVLDESAREIELYRQHGDCYGYAFFVVGT